MSGEVVRGTFVAPHSYEWLIRAERHMHLGQFEDAIIAFRRAASGAEHDPWLFSRLAHAQTCAGLLQLAHDTIEKASRHFPAHPWLELERQFVESEAKRTETSGAGAKPAQTPQCQRYFSDEKPLSDENVPTRIEP